MKRPRVKICGMTRAEDAALAVDLGADALGFICWPGSPRYISPDAIRRITHTLPPFVTRVGVFVNPSPREVVDVVRFAGLDAAQLHGDEVAGDFASSGVRLIKMVNIEDDAGMAAALALEAAIMPIVDAVDPTQRGGTGSRANWSRAAALARQRRIVLAGGLTADNVAAAVRQVRPWAVDVSSGVEREPGIKQADRLRAFFGALAHLALEDA